ncbi:unnamed protein product [Euphydryas editha]|uniref:Reverse transcriptase n=1 Tax=Euphydryas editha TaxID=104508 RepID=A0AAU9TVR0_EUPED|nr:unnamed protein product [Euphydryas editha]
MQDVFKTLDWSGRGINGEYISHLYFADNIVIFAKTLEELGRLLHDLNEPSIRRTLQYELVNIYDVKDINT